MNTSCGKIRTVQLSEDKCVSYVYFIKNVKNINLRVKSNLDVVVSINRHVSLEELDKFIASKADFILNALDKFRELQKYAPRPKQYISGEGFKILGRDLRLKLSEGKEESIFTDGVYLFLVVKDNVDYERKKTLVDCWLYEQCKSEFEDVCIKIYGIFRKYGVSCPQIRIREMKSRWGSCQPKRGTITLNIRLIEAPRNCIEYVVLHEFCHFIHPNHSKKFYAFMQMLMPDWKERKRILESQEYYIGEAITE